MIRYFSLLLVLNYHLSLLFIDNRMSYDDYITAVQLALYTFSRFCTYLYYKIPNFVRNRLFLARVNCYVTVEIERVLRLLDMMAATTTL